MTVQLSRRQFSKLFGALALGAALPTKSFAAEEEIEFTIAHTYGKIFRPIHTKIIKEFNKIHPNIHIRLEAPMSDYEELTQRTLSGIAQGNAPVLSFQGVNQFRQYIELGAAYDITPFTQEDPRWGADSDYYPEMMKLCNFGGKQYGVPFAISTPIMYANHTLLAKSDMVSVVDSLVAPMSLVNALIVAIGQKKKGELARIFENLEEAYSTRSEKSLDNMLHASHYAGRAFSKSYVGYVHALAHALGGKYNTPHGLANAVLLSPVLKAYGSAIHKKLKKICIFCGFADEGASPEKAAEIFFEKLDGLERAIGIPLTLPEIKSGDLDLLVNYAYKEAYPLYPVPVLWDKDKLKSMYREVMTDEQR